MLNANMLRAALISGAVAVCAAGAMAPAQAAEGRNAAAAAGAIGGFAAGAAVGSAVGGPRYYDPPHTATTRVYRDRRVVVDDEPDCRMVVTKRVNRFGERVTVRREVCD